jgi:hypothetical protein
METNNGGSRSVNKKKNKRFFMITISLALIVAGLLGILAFVKGGGFGGNNAACPLNQTLSTCTNATVTGGTITGGVVGALQSGGIITGVVALFVVALGALILINTMRTKE